MIAPNWAMNPMKDRNNQNGSKSTNHKDMTFRTLSTKHLFPRRSAKMIDGTEKPKIPSNNKNDLWLATVTFL